MNLFHWKLTLSKRYLNQFSPPELPVCVFFSVFFWFFPLSVCIQRQRRRQAMLSDWFRINNRFWWILNAALHLGLIKACFDGNHELWAITNIWINIWYSSRLQFPDEPCWNVRHCESLTTKKRSRFNALQSESRFCPVCAKWWTTMTCEFTKWHCIRAIKVASRSIENIPRCWIGAGPNRDWEMTYGKAICSMSEVPIMIYVVEYSMTCNVLSLANRPTTIDNGSIVGGRFLVMNKHNYFLFISEIKR